MALINTLRKRMGKIVVGVVAFSMFAFILTDLLQSNSTLLGGRDMTVAVISDDEVSYTEFQNQVDQLTYTFAINNGRNPRAEETETIREQAWNALILQNAYRSQYDAIGLEVTDAEVVDMVQGNNIDPQIQQFFTDPNTGEFRRENVVAFLQQLNSAPEQQRASWLSFEEKLRPGRLVRKYENLFEKTTYVTSAEAKNKYMAQGSNMTVTYLYVPYFSVADSLFTVSDTEMEDYLADHSDEYQREESRSINYVVFPVTPSAEDSAFVREEISQLREGLTNAKNDSIYASVNSDGATPFQSISSPDAVPVGLVGAEAGTVSEPVLAGNTYVISKLVDITEGDEYFVKARHILIEPDGNSASAKDAARSKASDLIRQLQRGADFAELAAGNSADQANANSGGDLGWVGEDGSLVQPFKDALFEKRGTGLITKPVETSFGYHIISVDEPKTNKVYKVAMIEKALFASDETMNETYRRADLISTNSDDAASLTASAQEAGVTVRSANAIRKNDSRVGTITDARNIVVWLYNEASVGEVSEVFELENNYVVAVMTGRQEEGTAKLSQVESEIRGKVLNEKKAAHIKEKLSAIEGDEFDAIKAGYGEAARTGEADLTLSSNSFPNVGFAPEAVGVAFSLEEGEKTAPFDATNGVLMIQATAKSLPEPQEDYQAYKAEVQNERRSRKTVVANFPLSFYPLFVSQALDNAIKEFAEIEDNRYKFF